MDKLAKIKKLADAMYNAAMYLTTDASRLHKAMDEYHKFIIHEWREEPVSEELGEYINELSKQFPEVSFAKLSRIAVRVAKWQKEKDAILPKVWNRENLDDFSYQTAYDLSNDWAKETPTWHDVEMACKLGAKWQKKHLWKPADGDDLPEIDREVIALIDNGKVVFAHRPDPKGWDAKSIITEKVEHYTPETYGKGGWNQPNVKWWLDVDKLPNMEG